MSAARVDYSYSQNFTDEVKWLCEEYKQEGGGKLRRVFEGFKGHSRENKF